MVFSATKNVGLNGVSGKSLEQSRRRVKVWIRMIDEVVAQ